MSELKVNTISPFNSTSISVNTPGGLIVSGDLSSSNGNVLIGNYSMASAPNNAATSKYYVDQQFAVRGLSSGQVGASQFYVDSAIGNLSSSLPNTYLVKSSLTGQIHSGGGLTFSAGPYTFGSGGLLLNVDTSTNTVGVGATAPYSASSVKLHVVGTIGLGNGSNANAAVTSRLYNDSSNNLYINGYNQVNLQVAGTTKITSTSATTTFSTSNQIVVSDTTDSSSTPTGALTVAGGVGVAKNLWVGGSLGVASGVTFTNSTDSSSTTTGALVVSGGVGVAKKLWVGGTINAIGGLTASGATFTGLITLAGATSSALISCATTPTQGQHLANKTYVDNPHLWSSASMTAVEIGGIIMTGEGQSLQGGVNWKPGDTTIAMYVGTVGDNPIYRYRPIAISGGTAVPGTFKCIGISEQKNVSGYTVLWQRIA